MSSPNGPGSSIALPIGARMDHYEISGVLGIGNFGVTYKAFSHRFHAHCVIKELLPGEYATRETSSQSVVPISPDATKVFDHCRRDFLREATILHSIHHPNVMKVLDIFDRNGTSYYVMPFTPGGTFEHRLARQRDGARISEAELLVVLHGVMDGLECVHRQGYLHRDIKPDNILITETGDPVLFDFGAARQLIGSRSRPMSAILTRCYAPFEQYSITQNQGPYTDIYALGAVFHRAMTGSLPPEAPERLDQDPYHPLLNRPDVAGYSRELRHAIDWALRPLVKERPQTIPVLRKCLPPPPVKHKALQALRAGAAAMPASAADLEKWMKSGLTDASGMWSRLPGPAKLALLLLIPFFAIFITLFVLLSLLDA